MLTNIDAGLLVQLGRQIEAGSSPKLPNQLQIQFTSIGSDNVTRIANRLSDEDVVSFFKALVYFEKRVKRIWMTGGSVCYLLPSTMVSLQRNSGYWTGESNADSHGQDDDRAHNDKIEPHGLSPSNVGLSLI